jgi:hypothetical protein
MLAVFSLPTSRTPERAFIANSKNSLIARSTAKQGAVNLKLKAQDKVTLDHKAKSRQLCKLVKTHWEI